MGLKEIVDKKINGFEGSQPRYVIMNPNAKVDFWRELDEVKVGHVIRSGELVGLLYRSVQVIDSIGLDYDEILICKK